MDMTPERWASTARYLREVFGNNLSDEDPIERTLAGLCDRANADGLPAISITGDVGRLLTVLTSLASRTAASTGRIVEVGTLGGYSALWMVRGLPPNGRLVTIDCEVRHVAFARREFAASGVGERVDVRLGTALTVLPKLAREFGPASLDLAFLDAEKCEYEQYAAILKPMLRVGGLLVADNALGSGSWWVCDDDPGPDERAVKSKAGVDRFNRAMAADRDFETACVPIREGVLIATRVR